MSETGRSELNAPKTVATEVSEPHVGRTAGRTLHEQIPVSLTVNGEVRGNILQRTRCAVSVTVWTGPEQPKTAEPNLLARQPSLDWKGRTMSRRTPIIVLAAITCTLGATGLGVAVFAQSSQSSSTVGAQTASRQLPQYTSSGELVLPKNWREWVYVGSPLTPNALNHGHANFPEYHNVYIESGSYKIYKKTGAFPEGTIMFKELQLSLPEQFADGSRTEASGRGFFPGEFNGADVSVKDTKRYANTNGWGYYTFNHHLPLATTAKLEPKVACAYCHIAGAKRDMVWTQFYRILGEVPDSHG